MTIFERINIKNKDFEDNWKNLWKNDNNKSHKNEYDTSFSKFEIYGEDAEKFLNRICANKIPKRDGGIALVHMLTNLGGIECEATVTRLSKIKSNQSDLIIFFAGHGLAMSEIRNKTNPMR